MSDFIENKYPAKECFRAALRAWLDKSGKKQKDAISDLGIPASSIKNFLSKSGGLSFEKMEEIANRLGRDLADMLIEGRAILAGETPSLPVEAKTPLPPPTITPEREMELLRQIAEMAVKQGKITDELLAKAEVISTTTEALRIKDIELGEKRELLTAKDKIIQQLVDLLKEAGLEHTIPPALISSIRADREKSRAR